MPDPTLILSVAVIAQALCLTAVFCTVPILLWKTIRMEAELRTLDESVAELMKLATMNVPTPTGEVRK